MLTATSCAVMKCGSDAAITTVTLVEHFRRKVTGDSQKGTLNCSYCLSLCVSFVYQRLGTAVDRCMTACFANLAVTDSAYLFFLNNY